MSMFKWLTRRSRSFWFEILEVGYDFWVTLRGKTGPDRTFRIWDNGEAIRCLRCNTSSWNPEDVADLWCPVCQQSHRTT